MMRFQTSILSLTSLLLLAIVSSVSAQSPRIAVQVGYNHVSQTGEFAESFGDDEGPVSENIGTSTCVLLRITKQISLFKEYAVARFGLDNLEMENGRYRIPYRITGVRYWFPTSFIRYPYLQIGIGKYQSLFRGSMADVNLDIDSDWASGVTFGGGLLLSVGRLGLDLGVSCHSVKVLYRPPEQPPDSKVTRLDQEITWIGFNVSISLALVNK